MAVIFTTKKMCYDLVPSLSYHICDLKFFGCTVCFNFDIAQKGAMLSPESCTLFH